MSPEQSRRSTLRSTNFALLRPNPHRPALLDTRGSTARVAHREDGRDTRDQAAPRGIRRNWAGSGTTPVAAVRASRIVRKGRAPPAAGGCEAQQLTPLSAMKTNKRTPVVAHDLIRTVENWHSSGRRSVDSSLMVLTFSESDVLLVRISLWHTESLVRRTPRLRHHVRRDSAWSDTLW